MNAHLLVLSCCGFFFSAIRIPTIFPLQRPLSLSLSLSLSTLSPFSRSKNLEKNRQNNMEELGSIWFYQEVCSLNNLHEDYVHVFAFLCMSNSRVL